MVDGGEGAVWLVVVSYNRPMEEIRSLPEGSTSGASKTYRYMVCDNSEVETPGAREYCVQRGIQYQWMGGNRGIACAYNTAVGLLPADVEWVCFLDQDTEVPDSYHDKILSLGTFSGGDVLMPVVTTGQVILSPCSVTGPWYRPIRRAGRLPRRFSCINSGMAVRRSLAERCPFDERLFLDYVDHQFVKCAKAAGARFVPMWDCILLQDYSLDTDTQGAAARRFGIYRQDLRTFYGDSSARRLWCELLILRRRLVLASRYRALSPFRTRGAQL